MANITKTVEINPAHTVQDVANFAEMSQHMDINAIRLTLAGASVDVSGMREGNVRTEYLLFLLRS
jgi:hypothetical protein